MKANAYKRLAKALDLLPGGYPPTKSHVELQILKKIFSLEEALIASNMTGTMETANIIADRVNLPEEDVETKLGEMLERDIIWGSKKDGTQRFRLAPYFVGLWESQREALDHGLAHLCEQYWLEGGAEGIMRYEPALHRVVPAYQALKTEYILPYDDIKPLILEAKSFEVRDCICRKQKDLVNDRKCDFPVRICFDFSPVDRPANQYTITKEETVKLLDEAEEIGLVHTVRNVTQGVYYVCNCCGCCCVVLRGITEFGVEGGVAKANYYAFIDTEECNGCGTCEERCQVGACSVENDIATIDLTKCLGCGLCVTGCPTEAAKLKLKPDAEIITPPENYKVWEQERLHNRGLI
jgi:ferredoxin